MMITIMRLFLNVVVVATSAAFHPLMSLGRVDHHEQHRPFTPLEQRTVSNDVKKVHAASVESFDKRFRLEPSDGTGKPMKQDKECPLVDASRKLTLGAVCRGLVTSPIITIVPIYILLFGVVGPRLMWKFSSFTYKLCNNGQRAFLFDHFDRVKTVVSYRIHPVLASGALLVSARLCFWSRELFLLEKNRQHTTSTLLLLNALLSVTSSWFGGKLIPTMYGNASARKWTRIQQYLVATYGSLALVCYHYAATILGTQARQQQLVLFLSALNLSLLVCAGVLERLYVLCFLSRMEIADRREYLRYYSPQFMWATIASVPVGIVLWLVLPL